MRLDKFLAHTGQGTRREVKQMIRDHRILINGVRPKTDSHHVNPFLDTVTLDENPIFYKEFHYVLLNKPKGYVCATEDTINPPVTDLLVEYEPFHLFPVGRLDKDTTGVLLLSNNGKLAHRMLSPKHHVEKEYEVTVNKPLDPQMISAFEQGIEIHGEYTTLPAKMTIVDEFHAKVIIHEGKYHQIKRMFVALGYLVTELHRSRFDFLTVTDLPLGAYRELNETEFQLLNKYLSLE